MYAPYSNAIGLSERAGLANVWRLPRAAPVRPCSLVEHGTLFSHGAALSQSQRRQRWKGWGRKPFGRPNLSRAALNSDEHQWKEAGTPAAGWSLQDQKVYYFAIANAQALMLEGALLEEVLRDGINRAARAGRPRDVWLVMEPAFLEDHSGLAALRKRLQKPTAAIVTTNGDWLIKYARLLLPQTVIGKLKAPTRDVPNPLKSNLKPGQSVIGGGGGVWH